MMKNYTIWIGGLQDGRFEAELICEEVDHNGDLIDRVRLIDEVKHDTLYQAVASAAYKTIQQHDQHTEGQ